MVRVLTHIVICFIAIILGSAIKWVVSGHFLRAEVCSEGFKSLADRRVCSLFFITRVLLINDTWSSFMTFLFKAYKRFMIVFHINDKINQ